MIGFILHIKQIVNKFNKDEMTVYAAQASFFILMSAVPFIMVLLGLIRLVPSLSPDILILTLESIIPNVEIINPLMENVMEDLYSNTSITVLSITALTAIWSASRGMLSMERGLNRVNRSQRKRNYIINRLICIGYTIIFMVVCVMSLLLLVFGTAIQNFIVKTFPVAAKFTQYVISFRTVMALAILIITFAGIYTFVPTIKLNIKKQLPGAIFATVCWIGYSFGFSIYFNNFSNFSYMYGSLTAIILLMLWLYFCICILFFGAEINYYLSEYF